MRRTCTRTYKRIHRRPTKSHTKLKHALNREKPALPCPAPGIALIVEPIKWIIVGAEALWQPELPIE